MISLVAAFFLFFGVPVFPFAQEHQDFVLELQEFDAFVFELYGIAAQAHVIEAEVIRNYVQRSGSGKRLA